MNSPKSKQHQSPLTNLKTHFSSLLTNFSNHLNSHLSNFATSTSSTTAPFARIPPLDQTQTPPGPGPRPRPRPKSSALSNESIEERLAGVPVYALSNSNEEFVLIKGSKTHKSLGLFCLSENDADALLHEMRSMDPDMRRSSSVVPVALNKVFQLKVNGVAFRLIPEASQIRNAVKEMEKAGSSDDKFLGVPVFQSRSLILRSQDKSFHPVFFRKEDLDNSLLRASRQQRRLNPAFRQGDIVVASFEDIIKGMKDNLCATWDDVIFIPPGFDVSTDPSLLHES